MKDRLPRLTDVAVNGAYYGPSATNVTDITTVGGNSFTQVRWFSA